MKRNFLFTIVLLTMTICVHSQEIIRNSLRLPEEIFGYKVLKCDFHLHTVFSDGMVWPVIRIAEAIAEGLDAIAISDHIEARPIMRSIGIENLSHSLGYDLAQSAATAAGVILIPAVEITKEAPPGHFNALFIQDANKFETTYNHQNPRDGSYTRTALKEARDQNAFIFWNHPWYQIPDALSIWHPIIDSLYNEGFIDGIEVVNGTKYDPVILDWVQQKSLTNIANSDLHTPTVFGSDRYRTMTIVFAKERSAEGIREALENRRTVSHVEGVLIGDKKYLEEIFQQSIEISATCDGNNNGVLVLKNNSSMRYDMKFVDTDGLRFASYTGGVTAPPNGETAVVVTNTSGFGNRRSYQIKITIMNLEIEPETPLETTLEMIFK